MKLESEITRVQALIKIQKGLVHEPRDGRPVPRDVAKLWQLQLKISQDYLQTLMSRSKERKRHKKNSRPAE
jgi:hypothetical protein